MQNLSTPHGILRTLHIIPGFIGLIAFWVPVFAKKGGRIHIFFGWVFVVCAAIVTVSAMASAAWGLIDPASFDHRESITQVDAANTRFVTSFLGAIALFTLSQLWLGIRVIRVRRSGQPIGNLSTRLLLITQALGGTALFGFGLWWTYVFGWSIQPAVLLFIGVGITRSAFDNIKLLGRPPRSKMDWWYRHMQFMLTTGIAFHTAFLVFGANRYIGDYLHGWWALVPWVLPTAIGAPAIAIWVRYYRRRFGDV